MTFAEIGSRLGISKQAANHALRGYKIQDPARALTIRWRVCRKVILADLDHRWGQANNRTYCLACLAKRPNATLGERVKAHRIAAGMSKAELAWRSGLSPTPVGVIESDARVATRDCARLGNAAKSKAQRGDMLNLVGILLPIAVLGIILLAVVIPLWVVFWKSSGDGSEEE